MLVKQVWVIANLCPVCNHVRMKSLNTWCKDIHELAKGKGWYDTDLPVRSALENHALIHSEVAEATEEVRADKPYFYRDATFKPEGEAVELADAVIRIMDYFAYRGWDLEWIIKEKFEYNMTRPYRHGGKKL